MPSGNTSRATAPSSELENLDDFLRDGIEALPQADAEDVERQITPSLTRSAQPPRERPAEAPVAPASPEATPTPRRPPSREDQQLSPDPLEGLTLVLAADEMQATLKVDGRRAAGLSVEAARRWLEQKGVKHGIDRDAIAELLKSAARGDEQVSGAVAQGTPAVHGKRTTVESAQLTEEEVAGLADRARQLREYAELPGDAGPGEPLVGFPLVDAGEDLGRLCPARVPTPGRNVLGSEVTAGDARGPEATVGPNATLLSESGCITAAAYGYVCIADNELWVVPAVRISRDGMQCHLLDLAPPNRALEAQCIAREAQRAGVVEPLKESLVAAALASVVSGARLALLAEGRRPQDGADGRVEHQVDVVARVGTIQEDGTIDFKQRKASTVVQEGSLLAVVIPPTAGTPGMTLCGEEVPARDGDAAEVDTGAGVRREEQGSEVRLHAAEEGNATIRDGVLQVLPEIEIGQDVDYETGNIDFHGDVIVRGVIRGGFSVTAQRDVFAESMENGAAATAGGAVIVKRGIVGERTSVKAETLIRAQFAQDALLTCRQQVEIGSYAYGARIEAGQRVRVHGKGGRGGAVGGRLLAGGEIDVAILGSEYGTPTRVVAGVDREQVKQKKRIDQGMRTCERYISQVHESLGVMEGADVREFSRVLKKLVPKRRKEAQGLLKKLQELGKMKAKLEGERERLTGESQALAEGACVKVRGALYTGVAATVGERTFQPSQAMRGVELRLSDKGEIEKVAV